jgi:hypothetical protein
LERFNGVIYRPGTPQVKVSDAAERTVRFQNLIPLPCAASSPEQQRDRSQDPSHHMILLSETPEAVIP